MPPTVLLGAASEARRALATTAHAASGVAESGCVGTGDRLLVCVRNSHVGDVEVAVAGYPSRNDGSGTW